jgi:SlyX protein
MEELEKKIIELEMKFSFQDNLVTELNQLIASQAGAIERLQIEIKDLRSDSEKVMSTPTSLADEVPPHY